MGARPNMVLFTRAWPVARRWIGISSSAINTAPTAMKPKPTPATRRSSAIHSGLVTNAHERNTPT
jgi:hypothetical protein